MNSESRSRLFTSAASAWIVALAAIGSASAGEPMLAPNFRLLDTAGLSHELYTHKDAKAVVLFAQMNGCPIVRQSYPYFEELGAKYRPQGVVFLYVNSHSWDTNESIAQECKDFSATAPVLRDRHRALAYSLKFQRSAETFVIDPKTWNIVYRGMADDRFDYGLQRMSPSHFWLRDILEAMVKGEAVNATPTIAKGCLLDLDFSSRPDFEMDVAPILAKAFPTLIGPAPTQQTAMLHARAILGAILTGESAGRKIGLGEDEAETLSAWLFSPFEAGNPAQ